MKHRQLKRGVAIFFAFLYFAQSFMSPIKSEAHETYFLQVLIDEGTRQYQGNVMEDDVGSEGKHIENNLGDFREIFDKEANLYKKASSSAKDYKKTEIGEDIAVFSFTPEEQGEAFGGKKKSNATKDDIDRAYAIRDTLMPGLNDALFILNDKKQFKTTKGMIKMAEKLTALGSKGSGKIGNYTVTFGVRGYSEKLSDYRRNILGVSQSDFVKIQNTENADEVYEFVFRMPKGYSSKTKNGSVEWDNRVYNSDYDFKGDAKYITWHMLVYQANYAMFLNGWTMTQAHEINGANAVEEFFVGLLQSTLNGLRNLLGLYSLNELVYNDGIRGSSAWVHGAMPESWHNNVVKYHMVFQAFAWTLISLAIVKSLIQRNIATINPGMRVSLIEQIQNLLITGFILSAIFPIIAMFMYLNVKVVDIFGSLAPDFGDFQGLNNYSNWLAGMILQVFYFIVTLYLNFVYIMRSITLAILIAMAPLFVVTIAFGGQWKQLFGVWMKELLANIFLQSFHAFILAFFVTTTISSRGIEQMVLAFAMIPLTEFFRSMVMGQAGGMAHQLGVGATTAAMGAGMKALGVAGKGGKAMAGKFGGKDDAESQAMDMMNNRNSQDMAKTQQQPVKSIKPGQGSELETKRAMENKETPLGVYTKGSSEDKAKFQGKEMSGLQAGLKDAGKALLPTSAKSLASGAGSAVGGIAQMTVGAGMMMALGGSSNIAMAQASHMVDDGIEKIKDKTTRPVMGAMGQAYSSIKEGIKMDREANPQYKTPVNTSGNTSSQLHMDQLPNGFRVHRDANAVREESGIIGANMSGNGNNANAIYQYDSSRLSQQDRANIDQYANILQYGSQEDKDHLRNQGVENVTRRNDGGFAVTYNRVGMEKMGIDSVYTAGSGENKRIVESKRNDQSVPTRNTINITAPPPPPPKPPQPTHRPSPITDPSGVPFQVPIN